VKLQKLFNRAPSEWSVRGLRWDLDSKRLALALFLGPVGRVRDLWGPPAYTKGLYHPLATRVTWHVIHQPSTSARGFSRARNPAPLHVSRTT
jgi:hypothetical protein